MNNNLNKFIQANTSNRFAHNDRGVQDILNTFTELRHCSREIENELRSTENQSIKVYMKESENIANLHNQIASCDQTLERMENMLLDFQQDLGCLSNEILSLQKKSILMSKELTKRQAIRDQLSQFIDDISVPETVIGGIMDLPTTDKEFLNQLQILNKKISFIKEQKILKKTKSSQDVRDIIEKLKIKAISKIKVYLVEQISKLRKPMTNFQIPQHNLLKHKGHYQFLLANERKVAQKITNFYIDTMSNMYYSYFKSYESKLMKLLVEEIFTKDDLLGKEDIPNNGNSKQKVTVFTVGRRGDSIIQQLENPIIVPNLEGTDKVNNDLSHCYFVSNSFQLTIFFQYPFESIFRSFQYGLLEIASREYLFITDYFIVKNQEALDLFQKIMDKTETLLLASINQ